VIGPAEKTEVSDCNNAAKIYIIFQGFTIISMFLDAVNIPHQGLNYLCRMNVVVIGGGAAGFFGALALAERKTGARVLLLEKSNKTLQKVRVSGGGRCNVTHACFDPRQLTTYYPRGGKELYGPFTRFGPSETIEWFAERGVRLKTEADGRMFPDTDSSQTIIDCLGQNASKLGIEVRTGTRVDRLEQQTDGRWRLVLGNQDTSILADRVLVTTGSSSSTWNALEQQGIAIVSAVPSLFTFNTKDTRLKDLSGISVPSALLQVEGSTFRSEGAVLITHWGLSGPGILKLSAWGARHFHELNYRFNLIINWLGKWSVEKICQELTELKTQAPKKQVLSNPQWQIPSRLWQQLTAAAGIDAGMRWADLPKKLLHQLATELGAGKFPINGKSTFKEEFVTAGGVELKSIDFKTFESKQLPGLYFAGEVLNIDAVTGGFNFQAAWTGGWIAGNAIADSLQNQS
jgi:hypothetical protein